MRGTIGWVSLGRRLSAVTLVVSLGIMMGHPFRELHAQTIPDLSGPWDGTPGARPLNNGVDVPWVVAELPLHPRAIAYRDLYDEAMAPRYDCLQSALPGLAGDPYYMDIEQLEDRVLLKYEKDDVVRTVWLDDRRPTVDDFSVQGFSVGRYEGDVLVIETSHFVFDVTGFDDLAGLPSSQRKTVEERYWLEDGKLMATVAVEDSLFLKERVQYETFWVRRPDYTMQQFDCSPEDSSRMLKYLIPKYADDVVSR